MKILLLILLFYPTIALSTKYYVVPVSGDSADQGLKTSVKDLIASTLVEQGHKVLDDKRLADFVIDAFVVVVGRSIIVSLKKLKLGIGTLYQQKLGRG